jgi:hypothetical protein
MTVGNLCAATIELAECLWQDRWQQAREWI